MRYLNDWIDPNKSNPRVNVMMIIVIVVAIYYYFKVREA